MQFVKTHMVSLICGALGLLFVGAAVMGMMQDSVKIEMENRARMQGEIAGLRSNPKNPEIIRAEEERGKLFEQEFSAALEEVRKINERKPLIEGVFPTTKSTAAAFDFKAAYDAAISELLKTMRAGDLPNAGEIAEEVRVVAELQKHEALVQAGGGLSAPAISEQPVAPPPVHPAAPMIGGGGGGRMAGGGMAMPGGGVSVAPGAEPKYNPVFRAYVNKARSIRTYASRAALSVSPIINATTDISAEAMWYAQVGLWVQQDVVNAIAAVNETARAQLPPGEELNVEYAPVKRLEKVILQGYQTGQGLVQFPAADLGSTAGGVNPGGATVQTLEAPRKSFLGTTCNDEFDVVRFTLIVIMDQRDILALIDALSRQNFCKCTHLSFTPAPPQDGYLYGADPVARVTLDFEIYYARAFFGQWMPNDVKAKLGAQPQ